ncbi:MAG: Hsp20 family protein [Candidatus Lokiarchaeota archaeon]|nr:Hsp20 family protein [Candidatus Lokiarchaeota archaeon]
MSWDDSADERREKIRRWFGDFLPEEMLRNIEAMLDQMLAGIGDGTMFDPSMMEDLMRNPSSTNPFVFGVKMQMGPDGKPIIQRFGNVPGDEEEIPAGPALEPLVDVIEESDEIVVVAELPGVERDEIKVRIKGQKLTIHVDNPTRPYHKEIKLPSQVQKNAARSAIRNGILEVRLKKA